MNPLLYTFRRCPYAIRARLAIKISGCTVAHCEVDLRNKPEALLACSPKGTVPVLQLADGRIIEESLDIMQWALSINDSEDWLGGSNGPSPQAMALIAQNDNTFKPLLDRYKYAVRFPEHSVEYHREQAERFIQELETRLSQYKYLMSDRRSLADMAILPFVRQFSNVDKDWFYASKYVCLIKWLDAFLESSLFKAVIKK